MATNELNLLPAGFQLEDPDQKFNQAADFTFAQEGGYMVDKGRPTNYGIRQDILDHFNQEQGLPPMSVTDLTPDDAKYVAKKAFFETPGFDKLPSNTATMLFDYGFNSGPRTAIKALQKTVGANPDGDLGPKTLKATQSFIDKNGEKALLQKIVDQRQQNYNRLLQDPSNQRWKNGWNNRIKKIKDTFDLAANVTGQGIDALMGTGTANADELSPEQAAQLPQGFQIEDGSAQAPVYSPSPAQAARGAMAVRGLPVLGSLASGNPEDLSKQYQDPGILPEGFNLEDQLSQGKKPSLMDKIQSVFSKPPEQRQAEAANIYAISKSTGLDPLFVEKNYDKIKTDPKVTGLTHQIDNAGQLALGASAPFLAAGAIEAPIATAAGMAAFSLLDHVVDLNKFVPDNAADPIKKTVEAVDFIGKALATHGVFKTAPKLAEAFTKQKIEDFKLPTNVNLSGEQVRDIYQTGKLTTPEQVQLYAALDLSREQVKNALSKGIDITIPSSKIVTLTDKPWWSKVKSIFGLAPESTTTTSMAGQPKENLPALPAPDQAAPVHPIIAEAQKHGTVVGIDAGTKLPIIDTSKPTTQPALSAKPTASSTPEAAPATPFVEKRKATVEGSPKNRLNDWTSVIDQYATDANKYAQISKLPVDNTIKGRLLVHYNLKDYLPEVSNGQISSRGTLPSTQEQAVQTARGKEFSGTSGINRPQEVRQSEVPEIIVQGQESIQDGGSDTVRFGKGQLNLSNKVDNTLNNIFPNQKIREGIKYTNGKSKAIDFPSGGSMEYQVTPDEIIIRGIGNQESKSGEATKTVRALIKLAKENGKTIKAVGISNHSYWNYLGFDIKNYEGTIKSEVSSGQEKGKSLQISQGEKNSEGATSEGTVKTVGSDASSGSTAPSVPNGKVVLSQPDKFYIRINDQATKVPGVVDGFKEAVGAKKIELPGQPGHEFFISRPPSGKGWIVSEARTGLRFADGKTQAEAVQQAMANVKLGTAKVPLKATIENGIKKSGLSPRYTTTPEKLPPHLQEVADRVDGVKRSDVTPAGYGPDTKTKAKTPIGDFMAKEDVHQKEDHLEYATPAKTPQEFSKRLEQLNKFAQSNAILRRGMKSTKAAGSFTGRGKDIGPEGLIKIDQKTFLSDSQYVSTLAHELGHAIEHAVVGKTNNKNLKLFGDNIDAATLKTLYNELMAVTEAVSPGGLKAKPEYYAKPAELIARFFEKMIASPGDLEALAPTAVKMIEKQAVKHPIIDEFLEATRNGIDKGAPKIVLLRDLRETYQKYLGKRVGNIAYGEELAYRAMKERGKYVIEKFIEEKFKGIKDAPENLFRAAESIKTSKGGVPEFGTRDYAIVHSPEEEDHLIKMGWEKMPTDAYENGIKYPLYGKHRYTPEQSRALYEGLSLEGQKLVSDFAAERKDAKDYFNRETIAETNKIDRTIEGWVHHYFEDEPGGSTVMGGKKFKKKLAASRKHRTGSLGYVEDFKKAMTKALIDLEGERVYNDFIQRQFARVTKPLPEGKQPDKGWVEVVGDTKSGAGLRQEKNMQIVDSATGKSFRPNYAKYQMPAPIYERYKLWKGLVEEASTATRVVNDINRYWRINILAHPGTAMTNFISGGVQYSAKILTDFYKEVLTAQATMPQTRRNISAMLKVLMPKGWMDAPDWVYGSDLSNFYGQFMKQESLAGKAIDTYANGALKLFGSVERYWKKVLITSEGMGDLNKLTKMSPEGLKLPTKEEREMLAEINRTVDLYAYDYDNVPLWMEAHQKSAMGQAIKPFAKWPYKYMKQVMDMIGSAFDQTQPWQDRVAKIMALSTIVALYAGYSSQRKERQQTPQVDPNLASVPARFQTRGRVFVTTDDQGNEIFMRTSKYPFIGLTEAGMQAVNGNFEGAKDAISDMLGGVGPMGQVGLMALSYTNKYQQYTPVPVLIGQNVASFIPLSRILGEVSRMLDPYQRKQETFGQTFGALVPTTDADLQEKLHGKIRTEKVPIEGDLKAPEGTKGHRTTFDKDLENHWQDIGLSLLSGIYVSRIDPQIVQAYITRAEKNQAKREEKKSKQ